MLILHSTARASIIIIGTVAVLIAGCGGEQDSYPDGSLQESSAEARGPDIVEMQASWHHYQSTDDLLERADLVVEGTILDSRVEVINTYIPSDGTDPDHPQYGLPEEEVQKVRDSLDAVVTVYTVQASSNSAPPSRNSNTVEVWLPGGHHDGVEYRMDGVPTFAIAPEGSAYLFILAQSGPEGMTTPLNLHQGIYKIDSTGEYVALDRATNSLVVSAEDVAKFSAKRSG